MRPGLIVVGSVVVIVAVIGTNYLRDRSDNGVVLDGLEPLPEPTRADFRTEETDNGIKYWPRSAPLVEGVRYSYNTGHCGLEWLTDFDGSFWVPNLPEGERKPSFFFSEDSGSLTVLSHDRALYRSSDNQTALLIRHEGPLVEEAACA